MKLWTDVGRRTTTEPAYTITSPGAFGSGELKRRVTVVIFKISDLKNVNFASFSTRRYNGVLWKTNFPLA